jgi:hypothetical protein
MFQLAFWDTFCSSSSYPKVSLWLVCYLNQWEYLYLVSPGNLLFLFLMSISQPVVGYYLSLWECLISPGVLLLGKPVVLFLRSKVRLDVISANENNAAPGSLRISFLLSKTQPVIGCFLNLSHYCVSAGVLGNLLVLYLVAKSPSLRCGHHSFNWPTHYEQHRNILFDFSFLYEILAHKMSCSNPRAWQHFLKLRVHYSIM